MGQKTIGLVAAMPDELRPLLRRIGTYRKGSLAGCPRFDFEAGGSDVVLIQSGMGPRRAREATQALIDAASPQLIVNFGFAGAVRQETPVGALVLASEVLLLENGRFARQAMPEVDAAARSRMAGAGAVEGVFITSAQVEDKGKVAALLPAGVVHPVLEMETAAVLGAAREAGIAAHAVRAISDGAGEEFGFSLEDLCDAELTVRPVRVLATIARKPWIVPQLMRLAGNSRRGAERLADCLEIVLKG